MQNVIRRLSIFAAGIGVGIFLMHPGMMRAQAPAGRTLDVYVIDVEGGNATLFVSPSHESLLIDTGNAGAQAVRDASRIMDAIKDAGLQKIDHLIMHQQHELIEIQKVQIEIMNDILKKVK